MPLKSRIDAKRTESERLQAIVVELLQEEENKYCADCEAKQPRWASWNLGVFLCIRCAGIHRNLGVHLTKVKSVNLDSWTPEQVQSMRVMGNKMARRVYEAELPEHFRRPQTDSALESFIRAKYEQKRYILKDWSPPPVDMNSWPLPLNKKQSSDRGIRLNAKERDCCSDFSEKIKNVDQNCDIANATDVIDQPLLDLNTPIVVEPFGMIDKNTLDLNNSIVRIGDDNEMEDFGPIVSAPPAKLRSDIFVTDAVASSSNGRSGRTGRSENSLEELASVLGSNPAVNEKKSTSDILALYGTATKFCPQPPKHQCRSQQFSEVSSGDNNGSDKPTNTHLSGASKVGSFFGPFSVPLAQQCCESQNDCAPIGIFGSETNSLPAGNFFLSRETAEIFAAASPFANVPMKTQSGVLSSSQNHPLMSATDDPKHGFAVLSNIQPKSDDGKSDGISCDTVKETKTRTLNHLITDFGQFNIADESREQNNLQKNILWN